jgi:mono/diheme cytochrome c family protein
MQLKTVLTGGLALLWCGLAAIAAAPQGDKAPAAETPITAEVEEFFEKSVRPVLAEQCYACHGDKLQQSGFRADSRAAIMKGTDAGLPGMVPGDPDKSLLIQVIRFDGKVKMPPQGKMSDEAIAVLTEWVRMGAPWPGDAAPDAPKPQDLAREHWAFQPVQKPEPPRVRNEKWVQTPVDRFILSKLEEKGMRPAPQADRRTLIRRAYFVLLGLPPSPEEVETFANDPAPDAYAKLIDRLLDSPHYGERWARHWLDVARYADSKGYVFVEERRYPFAYTYRDWVTRAFNDDLPYDQFLVQQIAADQLELKEDRAALAAMGFLTLGRRFLNNVHDIVDDRIDVVFRGTQGLTVSCARCHDHKYDPISIRDYYSLYGVFRSSVEPQELPLLAEPERSESYLKFERELKKLQGEADAYLREQHQLVLQEAREKVAQAMLAASEMMGGRREARDLAQKHDLPAPLITRWKQFMDSTARNHHPIFAPWHAFLELPEEQFAEKAAEALNALRADSNRILEREVAAAFEGAPPASLQEAAERYAAVFAGAKSDELRHALDSIGGPLNIAVGDTEPFLKRDARDRLRSLRQKVDAFSADSPEAPPRAMILADASEPFNPRVFLRGNPNNPGDEVPRQFLSLLEGEPQPFEKGSGRLEMAQRIVAPDNPLTARVMVNRVWLQHFGNGIVTTPSDFGLRSDDPSHPELLDFLASYFVENGWSLKKLHRIILNSATFQQTSEVAPTLAQRYSRLDPENTLLWRANRRRLEFEAMRDSLLAVSGKLDTTVGGAAVDITKEPFPARRTLYGFIDRQNLPGLFRTFDFASPDTHTPQRFTTTVPQQALFMMNSPFVVEQARLLLERPEIAAEKVPFQRVRQLYRIVLGREPTRDEVNLAIRYVNQSSAASTRRTQEGPWQYGYGAVDPETGAVRSFTTMPHFTGAVWQGGGELPDPTLGWVSLTAEGGHPGNDLSHATIRRWVAPQEGTVRIGGKIEHPAAEGDGIRAVVYASRGGVLGSWVVHNGSAEASVDRLKVQAGDTIDFVADCRGDTAHDSFKWSPTVEMLKEGSGEQSVARQWSAKSEFRGPPPQPLDPWQRYAQVLLMSNEFMFID